ncbi:MAG: hypothetical protein SWX82_15205 [Cyanobacteriota bacterium]|nr:hypothetical protein [Cyanobacteriota bacterium]
MSWSIGIEEGRRKKKEGRRRKEEKMDGDAKKLPRPSIAPQPILDTVGEVGVLHP